MANKYSDNLIPIMTSNNTPSGLAEGSTAVNSSWEPYKAFDGNRVSTAFLTTEPFPVYLQYTFNKPVAVSRYAIGVSGAGAAPRDFTFEGSNDGEVWVVLDTQSGYNHASSSLPTFPISNTQEYISYKLSMTSRLSGTQTGVYELEMYSHDPLYPAVNLVNSAGAVPKNTDYELEAEFINATESFITRDVAELSGAAVVGSGKQYIKDIDLNAWLVFNSFRIRS